MQLSLYVLCTLTSFFCLLQRHLQEMGSYASTVALLRQESILPLSTVQSAASVSSSKVCCVCVSVCACVRVCVCVCVCVHVRVHVLVYVWIYVRMGLV